MEKATFAAGCFWGIEAAFRKAPGVRNTSVGYIGGMTENPTYEQVCSGETGHAEAVRVEFDPAEVSYEDLLKLFWECHDPTTLNRQGPDIGTQYRSAIYTHSAEQVEAAFASKEELLARNVPVVTEIVGAGDYWPAEDYHQQYFEKAGSKRFGLF